uniref:Lipoma HMGIC fusion partner-like 2 protein n=1 Tax=Magallana gigas TaxID=29159 RepID=K1P4R7_MAGGI
MFTITCTQFRDLIGGTMCYVIVTCRSLGWTLLSVTVTLATVAAVTSPHWLIGTPRETTIQLINSSENYMDSETFRPTVGIFNRCTKLQLNFQIAKVRDNCATFVVAFMAEDDYFPHAWKACVILFAIAGTFLLFAMLCSVMSLFVRSICGKSIFNVAGFIQSIGGWSYYLGIAATVLVFVTAVLSVPADRSTTSRKVEEEMLEGKNLICVL